MGLLFENDLRMYLNEDVEDDNYFIMKLFPPKGSKAPYTPSDKFLWDDANDYEFFNRWLKDPRRMGSRAATFAYNHGIGVNVEQKDGEDADTAIKKARGRLLRKESWYDKSHYFWFKMNENDRPVRCMLRISNHPTHHDKFYTSHSKCFIECDTILNIRIGNEGVHDNSSTSDYGYRLTSIEVNFDPEKATDEQNAMIKDFFKEVSIGNYPVVTLNNIKEMFGNDVYVDGRGGDYVRPSQFFKKGHNRNLYRLSLPRWRNAERAKRKQEKMAKEKEEATKKYAKIINANDIEDLNNTFVVKGETYYKIKYNGIEWGMREGNEDENAAYVAYPILKSKDGKNNLVYKHKAIVENKIKRKLVYITEETIRRMVIQTLKQILY